MVIFILQTTLFIFISHKIQIRLKDSLKAGIAEGKTNVVIKSLLRITKSDEKWHSEVLLQSARYQEILKEKKRGNRTREEYQIALNQINQYLLDIIAALPENVEDPDWSTVSEGLNDDSSNRGLLYRIVIGLVLIFLVVGAIELMTGTKEAKPEGKNDSSVGAASLTVFVHGKKGHSDLILAKKGSVEVIYGTKSTRENINEKGQAIFNEIPDKYFELGAQVSIQVRETDGEPYVSTHPDSVYQLQRGRPVYLEVELSGLDRVFGNVYADEQPLAGVIVSVEVFRDTSDIFGFFEIFIPPDRQKREQEVIFYKQGYKMNKETALPQTGVPLSTVMQPL
ncbi:MAG: hypothetical protein R2824_16105 [Saprospiraceae bacterium]|nr:hypothetical protein [Lewinella sp.]